MKRMVWLTALITVASAAPAHAGIFDIIWEMSGPNMFGFGAHCEFIGRPTHCFRNVVRTTAEVTTAWLILEPSLYVATGKGNWEAGSVVMFAADPMIAIKLIRRKDNQLLYTAAGASFNYFAGARAEDFFTTALKLRPLTYEFNTTSSRWLKRVIVSWTLRYYHGISVIDDATGPPVIRKGSGAEWTHGPTVELLF